MIVELSDKKQNGFRLEISLQCGGFSAKAWRWGVVATLWPYRVVRIWEVDLTSWGAVATYRDNGEQTCIRSE